MRTILFLIILFSVISCKSIEEIKLQNRLLENKGVIVQVNKNIGYISVMWDCYNRPYKNQPCYGFSEYPISLFEDPQIGDTLLLKKK
jgi:hypothetical protein